MNKITSEDLNKALAKAMGSSAGSGGDFIPAPLAKEFIRFVTEKNWCRQMFKNYKMNSATKTVPKILSGPGVYYESTELTDAVETSFSTGSITLTARKLMAQMILPEELIEDSQNDFEKISVDSFSNALAENEERAMMTGEPSHTATAETVAAATSDNWYKKDARLAWNGLVTLSGDIAGTLGSGNRAADRVWADSANMSASIVNQCIYELGKYGRNYSDLVIFLNPWSAMQLLDDAALRTLDKYGSNASIFTGEFGKLYGKATCINSSFVPNGYAVITHKSNPVIGDRRLVKIKQEEVIKNDSRRIVISERMDFGVEYQEAICQVKDLDTPDTLS